VAERKNRQNLVCRQFRCRTRLCLLKGCKKGFRPHCPSARYCSAVCRAAARRWSIRRAQQLYRRSVKGRIRRAQQCRNYRKQRRENSNERPTKENLATNTVSEGDHCTLSAGIFCARPGCYEYPLLTKRSPLKKFCSVQCRQALRRVLERESRWRWRIAYLLLKTTTSAKPPPR